MPLPPRDEVAAGWFCKDNAGSVDELEEVKASPLNIERVEPVEPGMSAD